MKLTVFESEDRITSTWHVSSQTQNKHIKHMNNKIKTYNL